MIVPPSLPFHGIRYILTTLVFNEQLMSQNVTFTSFLDPERFHA